VGGDPGPMRGSLTFVVAAYALSLLPVRAQAEDVAGYGGAGELQPYLQCVPYAREVSGIQIYGDAWTWWSQAEGRYARGHAPRAGAVVTFDPGTHGITDAAGHIGYVESVEDDGSAFTVSEMNAPLPYVVSSRRIATSAIARGGISFVY